MLCSQSNHWQGMYLIASCQYVVFEYLSIGYCLLLYESYIITTAYLKQRRALDSDDANMDY